MPDADAELVPVPLECLRCGATEAMRFAGLCTGCRRELRVAVRGQAREVEVAAYEPKRNVTPNAVALKEE